MTLTNKKIYTIFVDCIPVLTKMDVYIPVKANFYLQKNIAEIEELGKGIEEARASIAKHYGTPNEEGTEYIIKPENMEQVTKELSDLYDITQSVKITKIHLNDLEGISFTPSQMQALMFMIEDN